MYAQTFPVIAGVSSSEEINLETTHTIALPTGIEAGDLLLIFWTDENNNTILTAANGWTSIYNSTTGNNRRYALFYKIADGLEGTSVNFTTDSGERSAHTSYRILDGTFQNIPEYAVTTGSDNSPNPPLLTPTWGKFRTLWIASSHSSGEVGGSVPNGFGDFVLGYTDNTGENHARMMTATKLLETTSVNPNEFSYQNNVDWAASSVAIQGANVAAPFAPVLRLMPLGDSITRGENGASLNIGDAGYRKLLIDLLEDFGYLASVDEARDFNFIGSDITGIGNFDKDNEGHSGSQANDLITSVGGYIVDNPPDIVLLHIGTNDIEANDNVPNIINEVEEILDIIYDFNPDIIIILAKIINRVNDNPAGSIAKTYAYNDSLEVMSQQRIDNGDKLYLVDAGTDFTYVTDPNPPTGIGDMENNLHPNDNGYTKIARVWFEKLQEVLTPVLVSPLDESINQPANLTFIWNSAPGAGTYHLQIATDSDFDTIFYQNPSIADTFEVVVLDSNVQYYWRVSSKINTGVSPFSSVWSLTTVLPVELSTFNAVIKNKTAELFWRTETEVNNLGFDIERKTLNSNWTRIGFVEGNGNSNSPKEYYFVDDNLFGSNKFIYRLKQIDTDGTFAYSNEIEINILPDKFELSQNYPNPFNPSTNIEFKVPYASRVRIDVYDILGQLVQTLINKELETGNHKATFDAANLPGGTYFYRILSGNFSDTKKMLLVK